MTDLEKMSGGLMAGSNSEIFDALEVGPLLTARNDRIAEYRRRKSPVIQQKIEETALERFVSEGWAQGRRLKSGKIVVEKGKSHHEILENRLWSIVYNFGAEHLNAGRNFQMLVSTSGGTVTKQIDVFAKFDDIVVVAECKSAAQKRSGKCSTTLASSPLCRDR